MPNWVILGGVLVIFGILFSLTMAYVMERVSGRYPIAKEPQQDAPLTVKAINDRIGALEQKLSELQSTVRRNTNEVKGALGSLGAIKRKEKRESAEDVDNMVVESVVSDPFDETLEARLRRIHRR